MAQVFELRQQIGAVLFDGTNFLVLKRNPDRYVGWGLVKGSIEQGETDTQAVVREVGEETGLSIEEKECVSLDKITAHYHDSFGYVAVVKWFLIHLLPEKGKEKLKLCADEWQAAVWLSYEDAREKLTWQTEQGVLERSAHVLRYDLPEANHSG